MTGLWGAVGLFSIAFACMFLLFGLSFNPGSRTVPRCSALLSTGISLGPLVIIVIAPFSRAHGLDAGLPELVLKEGRATLWWACFVASLHLARELWA